MDSITQIALGAAIGEVVAGREARNRAMVWGGVAGLVPDLDILSQPFYSQDVYLLVHRGISHAVIFAALLSPLLALVPHRIHRAVGVAYRRWWLLIFLGLFTHPLLDIMTTYGTGFLEPFSDARFAVGSISIVDPLYSLPLVAALVIVALARERVRARRLVIGALIVSHLYLAATVGNMFYVRDLFERSLARHQVRYEQLTVTPSFLNNLLWSGAAVTERHAWVGQYSHLDPDTTISFDRYDRRRHLVERVPATAYRNLVRFSKGYYILDEEGDSVVFHDLRFGYVVPGRFVFSYDFGAPEKSPFGGSSREIDSGKFFDRLLGKREKRAPPPDPALRPGG